MSAENWQHNIARFDIAKNPVPFSCYGCVNPAVYGEPNGSKDSAGVALCDWYCTECWLKRRRA